MELNSDLEDLREMLEELLEEGFLELNSPAHGAAKQYLGKGWDSLSEAQKFNFETKVQPLLSKKACAVPDCGERIPAGFRMCAYHQSQLDKANRDD